MIYTCDKCGAIFKEGIWNNEIVGYRGYLWHVLCANMLPDGSVDFPSDGKLVPETIMTEVEKCQN